MPKNLRIGIVTHYMPPHLGGIEIVAECLFRAYAAAGHDVRWIASRIPKESAAHENGRIRIPCWNSLESQLGVPWPVWHPRALHEVKQLVNWADVVHVHDCLYMGSTMTVWLSARLQKPVVLTQHIGLSDFKSPALMKIQQVAYHTLGRLTLLKASHLVFCSPRAKEYASGLLGRRMSVWSYIENGIDMDRFHPPTESEKEWARKKYRVSASKLVVLFVGRLVERKGVTIVQDLVQALPFIHFLIVGDGPMKPSLGANQTWHPHVDQDKIQEIYHAADVMILPSHGEGLPLCVQEAFATGLPTILSCEDNYATELRDHEACMAVPRTHKLFKEAIEQLEKDSILRSRLGANARQLAQDHWNQKIMAQRYLDLLMQLSQNYEAYHGR